ncbi:MAG: aldehyde dehydrogenase family protein [Balneolales bacterium]
MEFLKSLGITENNHGTWTGLESTGTNTKNLLPSYSPVDGKIIASISQTTADELDQVIKTSQKAFKTWRTIPAPRRGEIVRQIGLELREHKEDLGKLVSYECGKIIQEGLGEVQEMIDICDFAVGLSRQLYGFTMHSERPEHRMYEQYHPLGPIGVISAFNFPVAVWSWNAMVAAVCGDTIIWKPSEKTPLTAIACQYITNKVLKKNNLPEGIFSLVTGGRDVGELLVSDDRLPLISATGSSRMGKMVGERIASRYGKSLLELGGNNAIIISYKADIDMAIRATVFGAVGTAGQRCTSTRRLIVHESIIEDVQDKLISIYKSIKIGNPLKEGTLVGPLIDNGAVKYMQDSLNRLRSEGGKVLYGGEVLSGKGYESETYVTPALCRAKNEYQVVQEETFAPILYIIPYKTLDEAIALHNNVVQGLSSSIFTLDLREAEIFLSSLGSDCGIANVNIGTSGAEIGGAFGGEKHTGGGRESGSDAWKAYMRRQTNTINWGVTLPLAQGINFDI